MVSYLCLISVCISRKSHKVVTVHTLTHPARYGYSEPATIFQCTTQTINYIGEVSCIPVTCLPRTKAQIKTRRYKPKRYRVFHILRMGVGWEKGVGVLCVASDYLP